MDSAIQWINLYPLDSAIGFANAYHWIEIYPMDSAIQLLNNWAPPVSDGTCKSHKRLLSLGGKDYDKLKLVGT